MKLDDIRQSIMADKANQAYTQQGIEPLFHTSKEAKILLIGQAPGIRAQESRIYFNDPSGDNLRDWLGVDREEFYESSHFAVMPMDFYFPGAGKSGDLPPRRDFAARWHPQLLSQMPSIALTILIGQYAQDFYLPDSKHKTVTARVQHYKDYWPEYFPLVHPSPRNNIWQARNPWFKEDVLPDLKERVRTILQS